MNIRDKGKPHACSARWCLLRHSAREGTKNHTLPFNGLREKTIVTLSLYFPLLLPFLNSYLKLTLRNFRQQCLKFLIVHSVQYTLCCLLDLYFSHQSTISFFSLFFSRQCNGFYIFAGARLHVAETPPSKFSLIKVWKNTFKVMTRGRRINYFKVHIEMEFIFWDTCILVSVPTGALRCTKSFSAVNRPEETYLMVCGNCLTQGRCRPGRRNSVKI